MPARPRIVRVIAVLDDGTTLELSASGATHYREVVDTEGEVVARSLARCGGNVTALAEYSERRTA